MAQLRADIQELVEREHLHYVGATRKAVVAAADVLGADDRALVVAAGQVAVYLPLVPAPERLPGALVACDRGVAVSTRVGLSFTAQLLVWDDVVRANVRMTPMAGTSVEVATNERRYVFSEQFRGPISTQHAHQLSELFERHLRR